MKTTFHSRTATGGVTIIDIAGRLTLGDPVTNLAELLSVASPDSPARVILNLDEVEYMDSAGLAALLSAMKSHSIKLINLRKRIVDLLRLTGTYALFDVQPDEQSAIMGFH